MDRFNFIITVFCLIFVSSINVNYAAKLWRRNLSITTSPPPSQATVPSKSRVFPIKPSIIVMVGVLTFIFFITFLLLLYAKHCKRANYTYDFTYSYSTGSSRRFPPVTDQKNSGVERAVVESLPVFRFESLRGQKDGLECAVCLNKFEDDEDLRLLPNCMHGFHVECVDTWLDAHSSCPLCRQRINSGQISMVKEYRFLQQPENVSAILPMENESQEVVGGVSRVSGRHSFAGRTLEVIVETTKTDSEQPFSGRRSLDSWIFRQITIREMGVVEHPRKDGLLLPETASSTGQSLEQWRLDHRITVSQEAKSEDEEGIIVSRQAKFEDEKDRLNHRCSDTQQPLDVCY